MLKKLVVVAASLCVCASFANAEIVKPKAGWAMADDYDKAIEFAKKSGKPVAILYAYQDSTCPIHNGAVESVYMDKSLAGMVKVVIYSGDNKINSITSQSKTTSIEMPHVYLLDTEGRLTSEVSPAKEDTLKTEAGKVSQLATWEAQSRKQIEKGDKEAAAGKFKNALKALTKIEEQDRQVTTVVTADKPSAGSKTALKSETKGSTETKAPGRYFPDLLETKRAAYEAIAADKLKLAKEKFDAKDVAGGRKLISAMVADGSDLDSVKEASALMKDSVAMK